MGRLLHMNGRKAAVGSTTGGEAFQEIPGSSPADRSLPSNQSSNRSLSARLLLLGALALLGGCVGHVRQVYMEENPRTIVYFSNGCLSRPTISLEIEIGDFKRKGVRVRRAHNDIVEFGVSSSPQNVLLRVTDLRGRLLGTKHITIEEGRTGTLYFFVIARDNPVEDAPDDEQVLFEVKISERPFAFAREMREEKVTVTMYGAVSCPLPRSARRPFADGAD